MTTRSLAQLTSGRPGVALGAIAVAWGFVYLFAQLPTEWQVALGAVAVLGAYVLFHGYRAHRAADRLDHTID